MRVKYQQLFSNECGKYAIKNLLNLYLFYHAYIFYHTYLYKSSRSLTEYADFRAASYISETSAIMIFSE